MNPADLSPEERQERGKKLCKQLARDVASVAPEGIGHWGPAWEIVGDADAEFVLALTYWESAPSSVARKRLREAYRRVMSVWGRAVTKYEARERTHEN